MRRKPLGELHITPKLRQWLQLNPHWDAETRQDKLDRFIFRVFPASVIIFALITVILFFTAWGNQNRRPSTTAPRNRTAAV